MKVHAYTRIKHMVDFLLDMLVVYVLITLVFCQSNMRTTGGVLVPPDD